jgi:uncharacterized protein YjeT (DUF2065 family)
MAVVIKIIGMFFVLVAVGYLLKPGIMKWLIEFFSRGNRVYFAALTRFALAVVFLLAARECRQFRVIFAFGLLFIISGLLIIVLGPRKLRPVFEWWLRQSLLLYRVLAVITLAIGVVIILSA